MAAAASHSMKMRGLHVRFIDPRASSRQRFRRTGAERFRRIGTPTNLCACREASHSSRSLHLCCDSCMMHAEPARQLNLPRPIIVPEQR
eukprot:COSAG01_NODE_1248_length_11071_cov_30.622676_1_plen_89_part_00